MRPDKKKTVHHDSRKKAAAAKMKLASKTSASASKTSASASKTPAAPPERRPVPESRELVRPSSADGDEEGAGQDTSSGRYYGKRGVASNWTKYEIPSSDDDDGDGGDGRTGEDFNYVMQKAAGSDSFFRLKAEREWDEQQDTFNNEFFALGLMDLEASIACIPLHEQLDLDREEMGEITLTQLADSAARHRMDYASTDIRQEAMEDVNRRMLERLRLPRSPPEPTAAAAAPVKKSADEKVPSHAAQASIPDTSVVKDADHVVGPNTPGLIPGDSNPTSENVEELEDWLDDFLDD